VTRKIIYKNDIVSMASSRNEGNRTPYIKMNKIKRMFQHRLTRIIRKLELFS